MSFRAKFEKYNASRINPYSRLAARTYARFHFLQPRNVKVLNLIDENAKVLDYGCGVGNLLLKLKEYRPDLRLFGCDIKDYRIVGSHEEFSFSLIDNENCLPFEGDSFDLVMSQNVLEHLLDPYVLFREAYRVLKPKGYLLCETPSPRAIFMPSIMVVLKIDRRESDITMNFYDDPTHIRPYSRQALHRLANQTGFGIVKTYKARNFLHLAALPLHLFNCLRSNVGPLVYWFYELYGGANGIIARK